MVFSFILSNPVFGFVATRDHFDALAYFWRVIGHMLGIRDEFNLFVASHEQNVARLALVQEQIYRPYMAAPDTDDFRRIADALVDGLAAFNPMVSTESFMYFARMANGCAGYEYWSSAGIERVHSMRWWDRWMLWQLMVVHRYLVRLTVVRVLLNVWSGLLYAMVHFVPVLAVWRFGWRKNYVRILRGVRR